MTGWRLRLLHCCRLDCAGSFTRQQQQNLPKSNHSPVPGAQVPAAAVRVLLPVWAATPGL